MLINQAAWRRDDFGSTCFTATEVHGDFDGGITSFDATDAVLKAFALQSLLSSFCSWFVKRGVPSVNPVAAMDRPPHLNGTTAAVACPDGCTDLSRPATPAAH
jgi:hypothetical protein